MTNEEWGSVKAGIRDLVGASNFTNWIEPLVLKTLNDGVAHFGAPNAFHGNYVNKTFGDHIIYHLNQNGASVQRLSFTAANLAKPANAPGPRGAAAHRG